jgi:hypothetical protein
VVAKAGLLGSAGRTLRALSCFEISCLLGLIAAIFGLDVGLVGPANLTDMHVGSALGG